MSITKWFGLGSQAVDRFSANDGDGTGATVLNPAHARRNRHELADVAQRFITQHLATVVAPPQAPVMWRAVTRLFELYDRRPIKLDPKGSGFHNLFWMFLTNHILQPSLIVESGVRKGMSTWILRAAAPDATIHSFDITLEKLKFRDLSIHFHENDWMEQIVEPEDPRSSLYFFDDHVTQAMQIQQAHERGFRHLVFDDCMPAHRIADFGAPPAPTEAMLMDGNLNPGDTFEWEWDGRQRRYEFRPEDTFDTKELVSHWAAYPYIGGTSESPSYLTYVRLVA